MTQCVFCGIADGTIDATILRQSDDWVAFRDLNPQAPTHILVIPRSHVSNLDALASEGMAGRLLLACAEVAYSEGLSGGYRVVTNTGDDGGQAVSHLHLHVLGGRPMGWPPG